MDSSLSISTRLSAGHERRSERREERREERHEERVERREVRREDRREDRRETIAQWKTQIAQMLYTAAPATPAPAVPAPDLPVSTEPTADTTLSALPAGAYTTAASGQDLLAVA